MLKKMKSEKRMSKLEGLDNGADDRGTTTMREVLQGNGKGIGIRDRDYDRDYDKDYDRERGRGRERDRIAIV
ncbi:hypothetical protein NC651_029447 [Populus alba x Populus x berolinensis]|nr:hypothetical protein NC651_029447 [Populus alba x Populus x berolinensis]